MSLRPASSNDIGQTCDDGTTCERGHNQTPNPWTSCAAASRAKTLAQHPQQEQESTENEADCGPNLQGSFAQLDRGSLCWRTMQCSLFGGLIEFSGTWPQAGMMRSGACFRLTSLEHRTNESGCTLLPTPRKAMGERGWGLSRTGRQRYSKDVQENAWRFGYKPPVGLLEWMMGFPPDHTATVSEPSETQYCRKSPNGSDTR